MPRVNLLDTRTANFSELVSNNKTYRVPPFQRDYSWEIENWEDLWQDILLLHQDLDTSHYMGAIVLQSSVNRDKEFSIIDGQQRFATLSLIAIAVLNRIQQLIDRGIEADANQERLEILRRTYLGDKDPRSLRYSSKLLLNETNDSFYKSNLINLRKPLNLKSLSKSNQLLWRAFEYFSQQLELLKSVVQDGEKLVEFLTDTVTQRLLFIQITVEDELNAYTVFETLNARGIELSATDLLKNYLFSLFQGPDDLQEAQSQWRRIINTVRMEDFPQFLRYCVSLQQPKVRGERLFKTVRNAVKDGQQAFDLLDELEGYSTFFIALGNASDEFWREMPQNQPFIRELNLFRLKQVYPTLFAAYKNFSPGDFTRLLKLVTVFSFRYNIVSSLNPNAVESIYSDVAMQIAQGNITGPSQVFDALRPVYVQDEKFQQDFSLLSISTKGGNSKRLARYILFKLEADASGIEVNEDSFSIEHILPESPSSDWLSIFTDNQAEEMVYRLGNLTPLEPQLNRLIGRECYQAKKEKYQQSVYTLTQQITADEWTPDTLSNRQKLLARRAAHIWRSDFL